MTELVVAWPLRFWVLTVHQTLYRVELAGEGAAAVVTLIAARRDLTGDTTRLQVGDQLPGDTHLEIMGGQFGGLVYFESRLQHGLWVHAGMLNTFHWRSGTSKICALFDNETDARAALDNEAVRCFDWEKQLRASSAWTLEMLRQHPATQGEHARLLIDPHLMAELWVASELEQVVLDT